MEPLIPSTGWGVLHLLYHVDRERAGADPGSAKRVADAVDALTSDGHQVLTFAVLGHKADVGFMALGPDLGRLHEFQHDLLGGPLVPASSFLSLTELSEYMPPEARTGEYAENRLHPQLPAKRLLCFYPMSKRRLPGANWYELGFDDRKNLMGGHARVGREFSGRVLQLITGATGLDDWEWGVTLLADDPVALKEIVYEMRFDEVSARYAEFGRFFVGLVLPAREALARVGLPDREEASQ